MAERARSGDFPSGVASLAPDNRPSRANLVFQSLLSAIQDGRYAGGERIREEEIARSLGVSRTPVREALFRLQSRGLLEIAPGGLIVAQLTRPQIIELYAMREILEGSAARFAAQHAAPSEIASLRHLARNFEQELGNAPKLARINRELHEGIYEAAHNHFLLRTLNELHDSLALLPSTTFAYAGRAETAIGEHAGIITAIEKRNADRAERLAREHIRQAQVARLAMMFDKG